MRLKCIGCEVLARLIYSCAAQSPHVVDVELLRYGLHQKPDDLRARLQAAIDAAADQKYDAVVMAYGLCGKATAGLTAKAVPLVLPRAHDCITLFLGSRRRYAEQFQAEPGTYWYVQDYYERNDGSGSSLSLGADSFDMRDEYDQYVKKYGKDNADYLMEVMGAWKSHYKRAAYVDLGMGDGSAVQERASAEAARRGWAFEQLTGDAVLIRRLLHGDWGDDFLALQPGQQVSMTYDDAIIGCVA